MVEPVKFCFEEWMGIDDLRQRILAILDEEDIEGLRALGAPADEYEAEAELLCQLIEAKTESRNECPITEQELCSGVRQVWDRMFGPFSKEDLHQREPGFKKIASKLSAFLPPTKT